MTIWHVSHTVHLQNVCLSVYLISDSHPKIPPSHHTLLLEQCLSSYSQAEVFSLGELQCLQKKVEVWISFLPRTLLHILYLERSVTTDLEAKMQT